jgi:hypothetical protein
MKNQCRQLQDGLTTYHDQDSISGKTFRANHTPILVRGRPMQLYGAALDPIQGEESGNLRIERKEYPARRSRLSPGRRTAE